MAIVTVNRPEKLNALNAQTLSDLLHLFTDLECNDSIRVVIVTGAGEKAFVAGADIKEISRLGAVESLDFSRLGQRMMRKIETLGKPVLASINGFALGGGLELAMACTLRIAASSARLGLPEVNLGLMPGFGGTQRLTRLVGRSKALRMTLTGDPVAADDALQMGLVDEVVDDAQLPDYVMALANQFAENAPIAMRHIIMAVDLGGDAPLDKALETESQLFSLCCTTEDMAEGTRAFVEKRKATFHGC